jgi:hypothetical protein
MLFLPLTHGRKVAIQIIEPAFPLLAKGLYPVGNILESARRKLARPPLSVTPAFDETRILKHLEVL